MTKDDFAIYAAKKTAKTNINKIHVTHVRKRAKMADLSAVYPCMETSQHGGSVRCLPMYGNKPR